jgi:hypothetical protein
MHVIYLNFPQEVQTSGRLHLLSMDGQNNCEDYKQNHRLPLQSDGGAFLIQVFAIRSESTTYIYTEYLSEMGERSEPTF